MTNADPLPLDLGELAVQRRKRGVRLLDVRAREEVEAGHLPGSAWLPVEDPTTPGHALPAFLLPQKGSSICVVAADPASARTVAAHLCQRGFRATYLDAAFPSSEQAAGMGLALVLGTPWGRLWDPDPFLVAHLHLLPPPSAGVVVDLGCGSGRDSVFLAMHGYDCVAVDRLPDALELAHERGGRHGVRIRAIPMDLRLADAARYIRTYADRPIAATLSIRVHTARALAVASELLGAGGTAVVHGFCTPLGATSRRLAVSLPPGQSGNRVTRARRAALSAAVLRKTFGPPDWELVVAPGGGLAAEQDMVGLIARRVR